MDRLTTCYFCGAGPQATLHDQPVVPEAVLTDPGAQRTIALCPDCHGKFDRLQAVIVAAAGDDRQRRLGEQSSVDTVSILEDDPLAAVDETLQSTASGPADSRSDTSPSGSAEASDPARSADAFSSVGETSGDDSTGTVRDSGETTTDDESIDEETTAGETTDDESIDDETTAGETTDEESTDEGTTVDETTVGESIDEETTAEKTASQTHTETETAAESTDAESRTVEDSPPVETPPAEAETSGSADGPDSPTTASSPSGDHSEQAADGGDPEADPLADEPFERAEYSRVVKLLQNREFPVELDALYELAYGAYDIDEETTTAIVGNLIDRGVITERGGTLFRE